MRLLHFCALFLIASVHTHAQGVQAALDAGQKPSEILATGASLMALYGSNYAGGIIFYYDTLAKKGLVMSERDMNYRYSKTAYDIQWSCLGVDTKATGLKIGDGNNNTEKIISSNCSLYEPDVKKWLLSAAELCVLYKGGGFDDWFLPSKGELNALFENLGKTGKYDFQDNMYWSSSEKYPEFAWIIHSANGGWGYYAKHYNHHIRAVRWFED